MRKRSVRQLTIVGWGVAWLSLACGAISPLPAKAPAASASAAKNGMSRGDVVGAALPWQVPQEPLAPHGNSALVALVGATLMTATGPEIQNGVLILGHGRIIDLGAQENVKIPSGAKTIDVSGKFITPGLIDTHSHMGVYAVPFVRAHADGNEMTSPVTAEVRAADSFWPQDPSLSHALAGGVTTVQILPGSANLIGGQGVIIKLLPRRNVEQMRLQGAPRTLKMACGENPKRVYGGRKQAPSTRMGSVAGYRRAFQRATEYRQKFLRWQSAQEAWMSKGTNDDRGLSPAIPPRDFGLETLVGALEGKVLIQMHCYRADEMLGMLRLARQMGIKIRAFHHALEAYKIRDVLAAQNVAVSTWADWWGFKMEAYDTIAESPGLLAADGVKVALHSDSPSLIQHLNQEAAKARMAALRSGVVVSRDTALRWITSHAAWTLGIDEVTGSLEVGKMADIVVWNGDPFSVYSRPERVYIDGDLAYEPGSMPRRPSDFEVGLLPAVPPAAVSSGTAASHGIQTVSENSL